MAEPLSKFSADQTAGGAMTRAQFLAFLDRHEEAEQEIADAQETVRSRRKVLKDLRATIKASGLNLDAFDRARTDAERSGEEREAEEREYLRNMAWLKKPHGFQASMDLVTDDPGLSAFNEHELHAIGLKGFEAGRNGRDRRENPESVGSEAFQLWDSNWLRGQEEIAASLGSEPRIKRGPGRPKGSTREAMDARRAGLTVHEGGGAAAEQEEHEPAP